MCLSVFFVCLYVCLSASLFICLCFSFRSSMGHLVSLYMEDMILSMPVYWDIQTNTFACVLLSMQASLSFNRDRKVAQPPAGFHWDNTSRIQKKKHGSTFVTPGSCHSVLINTMPFGHQWNLLTLLLRSFACSSLFWQSTQTYSFFVGCLFVFFCIVWDIRLPHLQVMYWQFWHK